MASAPATWHISGVRWFTQRTTRLDVHAPASTCDDLADTVWPTMRRYASAVYESVCPSVCLTRDLCRNSSNVKHVIPFRGVGSVLISLAIDHEPVGG